MKNTLAKVGLVAVALCAPVLAFAQTPTVIPVPAEANQTLVNIMQSIQSAIFDLIQLVVPYALPLALLFLAIGLGIALFHRFRR